ncbi:MAG TPA: hypothetical protein VGN41_10020 [Streptosporangiaceae bacterium]|jgi:hypothetical protein
MTSPQRTLTGRIRVALPPGEAFCLFTPRGEQEWAHGWHPRFPAPAPDDTEPGTVFETDAHGRRTIWLVLDRQWGQRISYARVTPGDLAGTVTVTLSAPDAGEQALGDSEVDVTYRLTALTGASRDKLRQFADGYPAYLESWQDAIAAWLRRERPFPSDHGPELGFTGGHGRRRARGGALSAPYRGAPDGLRLPD